MNSSPPERSDLLKRSIVRIERLEAELTAERSARTEPIAIVGMGCRFPGGADDPDAFWERLLAGFDATAEIPPERWDADAYYDPDPDRPGTSYARRGGFLTVPVDAFDPAFFGIAPREAAEMDPQQRLLLEVVWEALERAGQPPLRLRGSATGVFLGMSTHDWAYLQGGSRDVANIGTYYGTGVSHSVAAGRIAYLLGLAGPAITIDTACSSSLVAFHAACQSLRTGESRMAIAAGVSLMLTPVGHVIASKGRMLAPDGLCKTFDASADGYVRGEGCGVVLLKRMSDARADGDRILALVRSTATNQDGRSGGLTAPSGPAQVAVMRAALSAAGLRPEQLGYVETHGTGTELGDPIEVQALGEVHEGRPSEAAPLYIGSVKTNLGHLESAAGIAGIIKTVLSLREGVIPPHLHFRVPNPHIPWEEIPVAVPTASVPWPGSATRIAGVSSFGFSGTNAHVVLEHREDLRGVSPPETVQGRPVLVAVSARSGEALELLAGRLAESARADLGAPIADFAATLNRGRAHWEHRAAAVVTDRDDLIAALQAVGAGGAEVVRGEAATKRPPRVAFLFTGQGSQRPGMVRELLEREPAFREAFERCEELLRTRLDVDLQALVVANPEDPAAAAALEDTRITQPALFVVEWALAQLWRSWGVEPAVVVGHSLGEVVAACVAGVLELEDALQLVCERGRLMGSLPGGGAMASIAAPLSAVRSQMEGLGERLDIAAVNGPEATVVSGDEDAVEELLALLRDSGIEGRRLRVSHAFHSHRMEPILDEFRQVAEKVPHHPPQIDLIANRTGSRATPDTFGPDYWVDHLRRPVLFGDSIQTLRSTGAEILVEIGPAPVLLSLVRACPGGSPGEVAVPSLRPGTDSSRTVLEALARLYVAGVPIEWRRLGPEVGPPLELPTYPFQRESYWIPPLRSRGREDPGVHPLLGQALDSPRLEGQVFEVFLREDTPPWIADHRVFGRPVLPASAFLEMGRAALEASGAEAMELREVRILEPLVVEGELRTQTLLDLEEGRFEVVSQGVTGWRTHAAGRCVAAPGGSDAPPVELPGTGEEDPGVPVDPEAYRATIEAAGVTYGAAFQGLRAMRRGPGWASGEVDTARIPDRSDARYGLHPAILDAAFQLCGACLDLGEGDIYLPVSVEALRVGNGPESPANAPLLARARLREGEAGAPFLTCDVEVTLADGSSLARVDGLRFQRATGAQQGLSHRRVADWLYTLAWMPVEVQRAASGTGHWRVIGDGETADRVAAGLEARGRTVVLTPFDRASESAAIGVGAPLEGTLLVLPPSPLPNAGDELPEALRPALSALLALGREAAAGNRPGRLSVLTRGAWSENDDVLVDPGATAAWGLGQTIAAEVPSTGCRRLDLRPGEEVPDSIADALLLEGDEDRLILRDGGWRAARLHRNVGTSTTGTGSRPIPDYRLELREQGRIDGVELAPHPLGELAPDHIRLRVQATGLNFRDVLNVLGMYPGDAGPLGSECAGIVEAVGSGVRELTVGDRVMAVTPRGFCSRVDTSAALAVPLPPGLTVGAAATVPIAFLTADWALNQLGRLREGERVLIHAATGGVGMAAVQLARAVGAEIFATAGSDRKRSVLRRMGIRHVYDSRSLDFRDAILEDTEGEGVHLVLNALADEFITASVDVLRPDGRFLEIGKTGVWDEARFRKVRPEGSYHVIYLGEACEQEPQLVRARFLSIADRMGRGELEPLPMHRFLVDDAIPAFRFMSQARHMGKVVLFDSVEELEAPEEGAAVWITGGLGGLGLIVARDLAARGWGQIILSSRGPAGPDDIAALDAIRGLGAEVLVVPCDVSSREDVSRARESIEEHGWRIRHVFHAAGVLSDAALTELKWSDFDTVLAPKVAGAWNLHCETDDLPLTSFVLFSAGAHLLGSPGQANYAAANAFLDGLAQLRRGMGLPALSIAWGPWAEVGMAARAGHDWSRVGMGVLGAEEGTAALHQLMQQGSATAAVLPVDWTRFPVRSPSGSTLPFFKDVTPSSHLAVARDRQSGETGPSIIDRLSSASEGEKPQVILRYLQLSLARVIGLTDPDVLAPDQSLTTWGFDSLMVMEIRNRVELDLGVRLPTAPLMSGPTPTELAHLLTESIADGGQNQTLPEPAYVEGEI